MSEYSWKFFSATAASAQTPVSISRSCSRKAYGSDEVSTWISPRHSPSSSSGTHITLRIACETMDSCAPKWRSDSVSTDSTECFLPTTSARMVRDITTFAGSSTVPSRQRAPTGTGASPSFFCSRMNARSASGNSWKMKFMIFSVSVARSVTAPSAMPTCAIARSFSTVRAMSTPASSPGGANRVRSAAATERVMMVGVLAAAGVTSEWNTSGIAAIDSSSPSRSGCQTPGSSRTPSTKVPLNECRSSTK